MTMKEACAYLRIGRTTFYRWIDEGRIPPGRKLSPHSRRWFQSEIEGVMRNDTDNGKEADAMKNDAGK